jgi:hypothetical protein
MNNVKSIRTDLNKPVALKIRKEAFNEALALGKYYRIIGDNEKVLENDKALQELIKEHRTEREVITVTTSPTLETVTAPVPVTSVIEVANVGNSLSSVKVLLDVKETGVEKEQVEV